MPNVHACVEIRRVWSTRAQMCICTPDKASVSLPGTCGGEGLGASSAMMRGRGSTQSAGGADMVRAMCEVLSAFGAPWTDHVVRPLGDTRRSHTRRECSAKERRSKHRPPTRRKITQSAQSRPETTTPVAAEARTSAPTSALRPSQRHHPGTLPRDPFQPLPCVFHAYLKAPKSFPSENRTPISRDLNDKRAY